MIGPDMFKFGLILPHVWNQSMIDLLKNMFNA